MTWTYGNVLRILCELYPDTMIMLMKEDIQNGITLEILMTKKHKKTPEEKAAVAKQKKQEIIWLKKRSCKMTDFSLLPVIPPEVHRMVSPWRKWVWNLGMIWRKIKWCKQTKISCEDYWKLLKTIRFSYKYAKKSGLLYFFTYKKKLWNFYL